MKKVLVALLLALLCITFMPVQASAADRGEFTIYISFEGYALGHGFYIGPAAISVPSGISIMDATVLFLEQAGYAFELTPWGGLDRLYGIHPGTPPIPPPFISIVLYEGAGDGSVGSFDYSEYSGWLFTVNHHMPEVGPGDLAAADGDVVRWQFSIEGWGADLGLNEAQGFWTEPPYAHADKTALIRALFVRETSADIRAAMRAVIIDPLASELMVTLAENGFPGRERVHTSPRLRRY